ncbi:hypothetical protein ACAW75_23755 [Fibrella sp. Tmos10]
MQHTIHLVQDLLGVAVGLSLLGWCVYRVAILFGIITVRKRPQKASLIPMSRDERQQQKTPVNAQKRPVTNLSRQALYTARKARN